MLDVEKVYYFSPFMWVSICICVFFGFFLLISLLAPLYTKKDARFSVVLGILSALFFAASCIFGWFTYLQQEDTVIQKTNLGTMAYTANSTDVVNWGLENYNVRLQEDPQGSGLYKAFKREGGEPLDPNGGHCAIVLSDFNDTPSAKHSITETKTEGKLAVSGSGKIKKMAQLRCSGEFLTPVK